MKSKTTYLFLTGMLILTMVACNDSEKVKENEVNPAIVPVLIVGDQIFMVTDLEKMSQVESSFEDVIYIGVPVTELLAAANVSLEDVKVIKAVAFDGYTINYELSQLEKENVIVAYSQKDGPLANDEGNFRMVIPGEAGSLNLRMLIELRPVE